MSTILHLFCGKIAAGKSTLAHHLASDPKTLLISEDDWMSGLYGPELRNFDDYIRYSARLRPVLEPHLIALLRAGNSIALDFPANTRRLRAWMRDLAKTAEVPAILHHLELSEESCKRRLRGRNAAGSHAFAVSEEEFDQISGCFEPPSLEEGLTVLVHGGP